MVGAVVLGRRWLHVHFLDFLEQGRRFLAPLRFYLVVLLLGNSSFVSQLPLVLGPNLLLEFCQCCFPLRISDPVVHCLTGMRWGAGQKSSLAALPMGVKAPGQEEAELALHFASKPSRAKISAIDRPERKCMRIIMRDVTCNLP